MEYVKEKERITNRHIAKLLYRLTPLNIPEIAQEEIKRQMWFLSEDIINMCKNGECENESKKN
jgi:hypothetical protein